jgi:hypothetical protein
MENAPTQLLNLAAMPTRVPDIWDGARKKRPGFAPICPVIVCHLAELAPIKVDA